jgi:hemerythrin-like domain-containing protein
MEQILKQILTEIKDMRVDVNGLKDIRVDINELKDLRADINELKDMRADINELKDMRADISELKDMHEDIKDLKGLRADINDLKEGQKRLEIGQEKLQKNLIASLGLYTDKIVEHLDAKTEVLNKRVYKVETEIERLNRQ